MITVYNNESYRITRDGVSMVENALGDPNLIQVSAVYGCEILVAPNEYGITKLPNGNFRSWNFTGVNTALKRISRHHIYVRLNRDGDNGLILFSVNDYVFDGKIAGDETSEPSEQYYYVKIGSISETNNLTPPTVKREINYDGGYFQTPGYIEDAGGWKELFTVTTDNLINALKQFTSFTVKGVLSVIGRLVLNNKTISDVARSIDQNIQIDNTTLPTTKYLHENYINIIRDILLNKDREDTAKEKITFLKGLVSEGLIEALKGVLVGENGSGFTSLEDGTSQLVVDRLYVKIKAIFDELEIKKKTYVGGEQILSPAGMKCIRVEELPDAWRCFFKAEEDGVEIENTFTVGQLAISQENNIKVGVSHHVGNRYYWREVTAVGTDYIDLSKTKCDPNIENDIPAAGDDIVGLGHSTDITRQGAIVLSSVNEVAPSILMYQGINDFSLSGKETISFDYDKETGKSRMNVYGDAYIGAKDESTYVRYTQKNGVDIKAKFHIQPGSTGWQDLDGLPEGIKEAADSAVNGIEFGKNNLLRNTGFTGDYLSVSLQEDTTLYNTSELYSPSLKYWDGVNAVAQNSPVSESGKEVVLNNGGLIQTLYYKILSEENYIFSFRGKGTSLTFACGGYTETVALTDAYSRYVCKFKTRSIGSVFSISATSGILCELQLERGIVPSAWGTSMMDNRQELSYYQSLQYISDAVKNGSVDILGGLILAAQLQLGNYKDGKMQHVTSGVSGIYNDDDDVAFWAGGTFEQAINVVMKYKNNPNYVPTEEELKGMANFVATHGGRAILNDVVVRGYIYALSGIIGGWEVTANSIQSLEYETSIEGVSYNNRTKFNNDGTITGNLINVLYDSGFIKSTHYGKTVFEWVKNIVSIPMVCKTPFSKGNGISTDVGSISISPIIINELEYYGNSNHQINPIGKSEDINGYTYYSLPNDLIYDGVTLRLHIDKYYGFSNNSWKNHNCYLVYYKTGDIPSHGDTTENKTLKAFKGKITDNKLPLLRGGMVIITAVAEISSDGSRNKEITWFVEMTC